MTTILAKAVAKAARLPEAAQKQLADQLLEDICAELKWDATLRKSQGVLEKLAAKARQAKRTGKTVRKGIDEL
jgi:hypothetical protein